MLFYLASLCQDRLRQPLCELWADARNRQSPHVLRAFDVLRIGQECPSKPFDRSRRNLLALLLLLVVVGWPRVWVLSGWLYQCSRMMEVSDVTSCSTEAVKKMRLRQQMAFFTNSPVGWAGLIKTPLLVSHTSEVASLFIIFCFIRY